MWELREEVHYDGRKTYVAVGDYPKSIVIQFYEDEDAADFIVQAASELEEKECGENK